jgi:hypothetical protein
VSVATPGQRPRPAAGRLHTPQLLQDLALAAAALHPSQPGRSPHASMATTSLGAAVLVVVAVVGPLSTMPGHRPSLQCRQPSVLFRPPWPQSRVTPSRGPLPRRSLDHHPPPSIPWDHRPRAPLPTSKSSAVGVHLRASPHAGSLLVLSTHTQWVHSMGDRVAAQRGIAGCIGISAGSGMVGVWCTGHLGITGGHVTQSLGRRSRRSPSNRRLQSLVSVDAEAWFWGGPPPPPPQGPLHLRISGGHVM